MPYIRGIRESNACIFCEKVLGKEGEEDLVIHRGAHAFVILNLYPYATGHLMVVPYRHAAGLTDLADEEISEATLLLQRAEWAIEAEFGSARQLVGINIGKCAGAGVEGHLHIHLLPGEPGIATGRGAGGGGVARRQTVSVSEEVVEMPEPLPVTLERLRRAWTAAGEAGRHRANS